MRRRTSFVRSELAGGGVVHERIEIAGVVESRRVERGGVRRQRRLADMGRKQLAAGAGAHDPEPGVSGVHISARDREGADEGTVLQRGTRKRSGELPLRDSGWIVACQWRVALNNFVRDVLLGRVAVVVGHDFGSDGGFDASADLSVDFLL